VVINSVFCSIGYDEVKRVGGAGDDDPEACETSQLSGKESDGRGAALDEKLDVRAIKRRQRTQSS